METKSTIQTQRTSTVLSAFIARFAGLRSHNAAFLPPLSKFRISEGGFRKSVISTILFFCLALLISFNGFAQTPTLTASTVYNPTTCGGTGRILFLTSNIANGSYGFVYRKAGINAAVGVNVTVAGNQFLMTSSSLTAGTYEGFEILNNSTLATIATTNVQKTLTDPASPTLTVGDVTHPTSSSSADGSIAFTSTNLSNGNTTISYYVNSGGGATLGEQTVMVSGNAFSLTGLNAGTYNNFTIRAPFTNCPGFVATSKTLTVAATCSQVATATQTMTWTGAVSTDWNNACNWSPNGIPTATNPVNIPATTNDPIISSGTSVAHIVGISGSGASLTVNSGATLTVSSALHDGVLGISNGGLLTNRGTVNVTQTYPNGSWHAIFMGANGTLDNYGALNLTAPLNTALFVHAGATLNNRSGGHMSISNSGRGISLEGTLINQSGATITVIAPIGVTGGILNNSGNIEATVEIGNASSGQIINNACGSIKLTGSFFNGATSTTTNAGLILISNGLFNPGTFTNNGVLKYNIFGDNAIVNNQNSSVIVKNAPVPIFTYGGTYNGIVHGIFTDAAATTSAGTFTAPNTFTPSTYPASTTTYYAKITPSGGACTYIVPFTYIRPTLTAGAVTNPTTCSGTGSIAFTTTNVANGTYSLSFTTTGTSSPQNVTVTNNTFTLSSLTAGVYSNFSLNVNGASATSSTSKTVANPASPTLTAGAVTNNATCGGSGGEIAFTSTNLPNGNYSLHFTASSGATPSPKIVAVSGNKFNLVGLKAGTYSNFSVTNAITGCVGTTNVSKVVTEPAQPTITASTVTNSNFCGSTSGSIAFTSTNVPDGIYALTYTASAGATASPKNVTVSGNTFSLVGLKAGTYSNFSISPFNCTASDATSKTVTDPSVPTLTAGNVTNTTACLGTNGKIAFTSTNLPNGSYNLSFTASTGATASPLGIVVSANAFSLNGLKAGTYSNFSVTKTGCIGTTNVSKVVADPLTPTITAGTAVNPTSCGGTGSIPFTTTNLANGTYELTFTATGTGATTSPQNVMVSSNTFTLSGLAVGTYSSFSLTRTGCTATDAASKTIANPATPTLAAGVKVNPTTCGGTNGSIPFTTNLPNGNHQLTYTGVGSPKMVSVTSGTFTLSGLAAGSYSNFSITNNGCTRTITAVRSLTDPNPPVLTLGTSTNPTACNLADGSIAFTATNMGGIAGSYPLSYDKDGIASSKNVNVNASGAFTLTGLADGVYSGFSITNTSGCTGSLETEVTLQDLALPTLTISGSNNPTTCSGTEGGISFTSTNLPNGTYPLSFSTTGTISPKDVVVTNNTFTLMGLSKGTYSNFSVNRSGCIGSVATSKTLSDPATPTLTVGVTTNPATCAGADGEIDFTSTQLTNGMYQLSFTATGTGATTSPQTVAVTNNAFTLGGLKAGTYSAFSITRNNCTGSAATSKMLSDPPSPTITAGTPINPTTCSAADGSIPFTSTNLPDDDYTLTYTGAGSPKIVSVLNNAFSLTGLDNGTYSNFSLSNNGCTASHNISKTVANPTPPTLTAGLATNPTTCASTDGKIAFTTSLANGSYTLTYTGAGSSKMINVASGAFELTGLADGTYSNFRITHSGCTSIASTSKTLSDPVPPTITAGTPKNTTTCGGDEGTIPFTTSLPDGQYTINYTGGNGSQMVTVVSGAFTLTGLTADTYSGFAVTVGGCTGIDNTSKTVSDPLAPTLSSPFQLSITSCGGLGRLDFSGNNLPTTVTSLSLSFTATGAGATQSPQTVSVSHIGGNFVFPLSLKAGVYSNFSFTHNGCTATSSTTQTFTDPTPPTISVSSKTNVLCNGSATGGFTFSVTGGSGSITAVVRDANNNPVATTGSNPYTVSGLAAGTYSINVSRNDCSASQNVTLTQPTTPLSILTAKTNVTINGGNNGTITVTASGGTGALQFSKDGGATYTAGTSPYVFNNLSATDYQIRVKDANNCETAISTVTITQPTAVNFTTSETHIVCNGASTGAIQVTVTAGTSPFEFSKDDGATFTAGTNPFTFNGLAAGDYKIKVKDNTGFVSSATTVTLTQPRLATATEDMTWTGTVSTDWNNACNWSPNGIPTATNSVSIPNVANDPVIMNGITANAFRIDIGNNASLTINSGGELNVLPTDVLFGISAIYFSSNATLTNNGTLNANSTVNVPLITLANNNSIFNNNGTANLNSPLRNIVMNGPNAMVNNSVSGIINFQSARGINCINGTTGNVITNQGTMNYTGYDYFAALNPGFTLNNSGTIDIKSGSGIAMQGGTVNNLACAKILMPERIYDNRNSSVTTNAGLMITGSINNNGGSFTNNGILKYSSMSGNAIINNQNSSVIVNNTLPIFTYGGTYDGTINGIFKDATATTSAGTFTAPNTFVPSGLTCGTQTLYAQITPMGGACSYIVPFTYTAVPPTVTITGLNSAYCKDATAVTLTGNPAGGTFKIDGNAATQFDPSVLSAGSRVVVYTYTDGNGCTNTKSQTVTVNALPVLSITGLNAAYCKSATAVTLTGTPIGGTFKIDGNAATQFDPSVLSVGNHTVIYSFTDGNSCSNTTSQTVAVNALPVVSITGLNAAYCESANAVTLTGNPSGGTFKIDGNAATQFNPSVLSIGNHTVVYSYSDGNGCANSASQTVTVGALPIFNPAIVQNVNCSGGNDGRVTLSISGGTGIISYTINPSSGQQNPSGTFNGLAANTYTFTATDANNCQITTTATVGTIVNTPPNITLTSPTNGSIFTTNHIITVNATDPNGSIAQVNFYSVINGDGDKVPFKRILLGSSTVAPFSFNWNNIPGGHYNIQAEAVDNCGLKTFSSVAEIKVLSTFNVLIGSPAPKEEFISGSNLTISASVVGFTQRTVAKVEFFNGNTKLGEDLTAPYSYLWMNVPSGSHALRAVATDNLGGVWYSNYTYIFGINPSNRNVQRQTATPAVFTLFPNPTNSQVYFHTTITEDGNYNINILDMMGRIVVTKQNNYAVGALAETLDVSSLAKGIYMVRFVKENGKDAAIQKLIIE